ncbi:MAG: pectate lyase [Bacteroidales bacterium]|nr:pectate lyase [Bacteroidales bacterium]
MKKIILTISAALLGLCLGAQPRGAFQAPDYGSPEGIRVADQILLYQRVTGGWPKNTNMSAALTPQQIAQVQREKQRTDDSTVDNNATTSQMTTLAHTYQATKDPKYREGFVRGLEFLLGGQYANGGWPQFWPDPIEYQVNITFNDNNMTNILTMFQNIFEGNAPYGGDLVDEAMKVRLRDSYQRGLDCILNAQIVVKKQPTVWCQQVDPVTLAPITGRAFELPSYCSMESARMVQFLMNIKNPDKRIKAAVHGAMKWFDTYKITGYRLERGMLDGERTTRLVPDPDAAPLWARFYDLQYTEPFVCDRDGLPRRRLEEIGRERRNGYSWFNSNPAQLYEPYLAWVRENDPKYKVKIDLKGKGGNENGIFTLFREHKMNPKDFDVVVKPGESIQAAIDKAPTSPAGYFKILVLSGTYHEALNINKPCIILVGEDRENTVIELSEETAPVVEGRRAGGNVVNIAAEAHDLIMSGFTLINGFDASPVDPKQPQSIQHRMVVMGRADRTILINSTIKSTGNDALSLWAPSGDGMYYHADLDVITPGVDFVCPRGWCYMTRCNFYGDGRAMIWHDGRGSKDKKFVITNSNFDAASPTLLGRYHHDARIYILHSRMSANILDQNIHYAYSDQVKDPCVWGERFYYYNNVREGGHSGWLANSLDKSPIDAADQFIRTEQGHVLEHWECTALWTFDNKWNPEQTLRDLWPILEY